METTLPSRKDMDCSLTHVLQAPDTQLCQLRVGWTKVISAVATPHRQDHVWSSPLPLLLRTKDSRVVKLENCVSKLNFCTGLGLCVGSSHPKTMSEVTKLPCKTMKIFGRSWGTFKLSCKKGCMMYYCSEDFLQHSKPIITLQEYQEDECKSLKKTQ